MIAAKIRKRFQSAMGDALDMIRISDIGDRQFTQMQVSLKNRFNEQTIELFGELEKLGIIKRCHCLSKILAARENGDVNEMKKLYEAKNRCPECGGSGYQDCVEIR